MQEAFLIHFADHIILHSTQAESCAMHRLKVGYDLTICGRESSVLASNLHTCACQPHASHAIRGLCLADNVLAKQNLWNADHDNACTLGISIHSA